MDILSKKGKSKIADYVLGHIITGQEKKIETGLQPLINKFLKEYEQSDFTLDVQKSLNGLVERDLKKKFEEVLGGIGLKGDVSYDAVRNENLMCLEESFEDYQQRIQEDALYLIGNIEGELRSGSLYFYGDSRSYFLSRLKSVHDAEDFYSLKDYGLSEVLEKFGNHKQDLMKCIAGQVLACSIRALLRKTTASYLRANLEECVLLSELDFFENIGDIQEYRINHEKIFKHFFSEIAAYGLNVSALVDGRKYLIGKTSEKDVVDPLKIRQECLNDYVAYCENKIDSNNPKELKKLEFAKRVLGNDLGLVLNDYLGFLYKNTRKNLKDKVSVQDLCRPLKEIPGKEEVKGVLEEAVVEEFSTFLQSVKSDERKESLELVLKKYKPGVYSKLAASGFYELEISRSPQRVKQAARATGSCIMDKRLSDFKNELLDPGVVYFIAKKNGRVKGYSRMFLMVNSKNQPVLAVDTMEPPEKEFEENKDLISAMALASVQLGLDVGAKYVVSNDSRIVYGPKEAFGKTERKMKLKKLGKEAQNVYCFDNDYEGSPYVLMHNWKAF
ncbi:MAG: hypothetical protein Q8N77_04140 [Nanoarchaeota archaeon]|nr:hypothetical protein [Nanoarchaeota archaeon]